MNNHPFPLLDDEVQIEAFSFSFDTGMAELRTIDNGYPVKAFCTGWREQYIQPTLIYVYVEIGNRRYRFSLNVGTCRRLVMTDRPYPLDEPLYSASASYTVVPS
jgi:hypothetical protein